MGKKIKLLVLVLVVALLIGGCSPAPEIETLEELINDSKIEKSTKRWTCNHLQYTPPGDSGIFTYPKIDSILHEISQELGDSTSVNFENSRMSAYPIGSEIALCSIALSICEEREGYELCDSRTINLQVDTLKVIEWARGLEE